MTRIENTSNEKPTAGRDTEVSKSVGVDEVEPVITQRDPNSTGEKTVLTPEMCQRIAAMYGKKAEDDNLAPSRDVQYIVDKIQSMTEEEAIRILTEAVEYHSNDPSQTILLLTVT